MATPAEEKSVKEVKASAHAVHISPRKTRPVARLLKNMSVDEARVSLGMLTKKAAGPIKKLVDSAVANASHNFGIESSRLFIKSLTVDGGPVYKRFTPRAQGRAFPIRKPTSHLNLVLGVASHSLTKVRKEKAPAVAEPPKQEPVKVQPEKSEEEKKSRFGFLRLPRRQAGRKKAEDTSQVPPKQDMKGKSYTSFDRRGNM